MVAFQEVIDRLNEIFIDEDFSTGQKESFGQGPATHPPRAPDPGQPGAGELQVAVPGKPRPQLRRRRRGPGQPETSHNKMSDMFFGDGQHKDELVHLIGALVQLHATQAA